MKNRRGFTLIEILFYIALLSTVAGLVVSVAGTGLRAWGALRSERAAADAGRLIMERIAQELRLASSVDAGASQLGTNPGRLRVQTFESFDSDTAATLDIWLEGTEARLSRNGEEATPLHGPAVRVSSLVFNHVFHGTSELVRVALTVEAGQGRFARQQSYISATVLRNSYEN